jgi:hypothetical protein
MGWDTSRYWEVIDYFDGSGLLLKQTRVKLECA